MHPPCEMMVESFLPTMRALVSRKLHEEGLSQGKIAHLLGVTQASVSLYLSGQSTGIRDSLSALSITMEEADRYSRLLAEDVKRNPVYATSTLYSIWTNLLGRGLLCPAHRSRHPFLADCDVCMKTFGLREDARPEAIENVKRAVSIVESSTSFVNVMPEVSVNIAYVTGAAKTTDDVVAIPGRIVRVKNSARSLFPPEYGASSHLARMLLMVKARLGDVSAMMNLRYDKKMSRVLRQLKLRPLNISDYPGPADDPVVEALRTKLSKATERFDAIVATGGPGLEPNLYLLGNDAVEVVQLAIKISRLYSAG